MLTVLLVILLGQSAPVAPQAIDVSTLQASAPVLVADIDTGKVQGEPVGLAWNADGTLYLRVVQSDAWGNQKTSHYLIDTSSLPSTLSPAGALPPWAASYWTMKTQLFSPKDASFKVQVDEQAQRARSTNVANAGDLAGMSSQALPTGDGGRGGSTGSAAATMDAANKSYQAIVTTMRVKGQVVGEWESVAPQPGMRFGWSPPTAPVTALAYAAQNKRLSLIDAQGHRQEIGGTSNVLLPAWSTDGKRIAFVQKKDKKHYSLMVVDLK